MPSASRRTLPSFPLLVDRDVLFFAFSPRILRYYLDFI